MKLRRVDVDGPAFLYSPRRVDVRQLGRGRLAMRAERDRLLQGYRLLLARQGESLRASGRFPTWDGWIFRPSR